MSKLNPKRPLSRPALQNSLKAKSRSRRDKLGELSSSLLGPHTLRNDLIPNLELVSRAPRELKGPARNVRKIEPGHLQAVVTSISNLGFCDPVLIDRQNNVLDGVVRVEAAKQLGLEQIPCICADHLSPTERRLLRMALNRLGEKGVWNIDELKIELEELFLEQAPIEIAGFSSPEIDQIVLGDEPEAIEAGPLAPEPNTQPIARVGDVFTAGKHRIVCGDATDPAVHEILMSGDKARLILTDEPFNVPIAGHVTGGRSREFVMASGEMSDAEFLAFNVVWIGASIRYLCDGGLFGTFIDWRGYSTVNAAALRLGLAPFNLVVWTKTNAGMGSLYRSQHELLPLFKNGKASHINNVELGKNGRWRSNVWIYPGASSMGSEARRGLQHHPTVKPVAMLEDALLDLTKRGDIVLDPFLGSGSALIAAEKSGRRCRGVELDPLYIDVVLRRYEAAMGQPAILEGTGETFAQLAARREREATADTPSPP